MSEQSASSVAIAVDPLGDHAGSIRDLGILTDLDGEGLAGTIEVGEEMFLPGTNIVRTSVLATFADVVAGKFANTVFAPRICVTLDLDLQLARTPIGPGFRPGEVITCRARVVRAGRRIIVTGYDLTAAGDDRPFAFGSAGFMGSPDPEHVVPGGFALVSTGERDRLDRPFAERSGVRRLPGGRAELPYRIDNVNATGALQGGLLVLCAEEALLAVRPNSTVVSTSIRYLRAFRGTTATATADVDGSVARIVLDDDAAELGAMVTARLAAVEPACIEANEMKPMNQWDMKRDGGER